jgi:NADH dehydrogenase FAD-containing subunit
MFYCASNVILFSFRGTEFEKIKSANTVLIVGGGPTGVELAGEISIDFPEKKVILVHRGIRLLEFIGFKAAQKALDWLIAKKVEVILDQAINLDSLSDGIVKTSAGETVRADCHFICTGRPMGSSWLRETILKDSLGIHDRLMVDQNLRVRGCKNIFAIGDITDIKVSSSDLSPFYFVYMCINYLLMKGDLKST